MSTFYQELLRDLNKTASDAKSVRNKLEELSLDELERIASELDALGNMNPEDLARMAQVMPVYGAAMTSTTQVSDVAPQPMADDRIPVEDETEALAAEDEEDEEKAESEDEEKEESDDKKDDEDEKEEKEDDKEAEESSEEMEVSASATLYEILKQGAAIEELIEVRAEERAAEIVEELVKQANEFEVARAIAEQTAVKLKGAGPAAHEFAERFMDKVKTISAQTAESVSTVASKLAGKLSSGAGGAAAIGVAAGAMGGAVQAAGYGGKYDSTQGTATERFTENMNAGVGVGKMASEDDEVTMEDLTAYASYLREEQEKLASYGMELVERMLLDMGQAAGQTGTKLFEFVQRGKEDVRTLAAKLNINVVEAAQRYPALVKGGAAGLGAVTGYTAVNAFGAGERMAPSPAMAGHTTPPPVNSNVTQDPDKFVHQMALQGTMNSPLPTTPEVKTASSADGLQELIKRALSKKPRS